MSLSHPTNDPNAPDALFQKDRDTLVQVTASSFHAILQRLNAHPTPEGRYHRKLGFRSAWHDLDRGRTFIGASWGIPDMPWAVAPTYFVTQAFFDANRQTLSRVN